MAVDFSKTAEKTMAQTAAGIAPAAPELPEVKEYNIAADRQDMTKALGRPPKRWTTSSAPLR